MSGQFSNIDGKQKYFQRSETHELNQNKTIAKKQAFDIGYLENTLHNKLTFQKSY